MKSKPNRKARQPAKSIEREQKPRVELDYSKPLPPFLIRDEMAELVRATKRTTERWAAEGSGPPFCRVNGRVLYETAAVLAWIKANERTSTSAPEATP